MAQVLGGFYGLRLLHHFPNYRNQGWFVDGIPWVHQRLSFKKMAWAPTLITVAAIHLETLVINAVVTWKQTFVQIAQGSLSLGRLPLRIITTQIQTLIILALRIHDDVYKKTLFAYAAIKKKDEKRLRFTDFLGPTEVEPTSHKPTWALARAWACVGLGHLSAPPLRSPAIKLRTSFTTHCTLSSLKEHFLLPSTGE